LLSSEPTAASLTASWTTVDDLAAALDRRVETPLAPPTRAGPNPRRRRPVPGHRRRRLSYERAEYLFKRTTGHTLCQLKPHASGVASSLSG
jgi:hypothetical protein